MGVAGVPAGGPAGASAGVSAGNKAGERRTLQRANEDLAGVAAGNQNNLGTVPVGEGRPTEDGTLHQHAVYIDNVRIVMRGIRNKANTPSTATLQVIHDVGQPNAADVLDTRDETFPGTNANGITTAEASVAARAGDLEISAPGATLEVNPLGVNRVVGREPHAFSVAMRGGSIHTGTLTTEVDVRPRG